MNKSLRALPGRRLGRAEDGGTGALIRARDWASTPLGAMERWPESLRVALDLCLGAPSPMAIYWGEDHILLYNDPFCPLLGDKHPQALGLPARQAFPEIWATLEPVFREVLATGTAAAFQEALLPLRRDGAIEDRWFDFSLTPILDADGRTLGILNIALESTARVLDERRRAFQTGLESALRDLADPAEIIAAASKALGLHLGAEAVAYGEIDPTGEFTAISREWSTSGMPSVLGRHRLDDYGPSLIAEMRSGRTVAVDDVTADPRTASRDAHARFDVLSLAAFLDAPVVKDGRLVAILGVHAARPRRWSAEEAALAQDIAERVWAAAERARAQGALRDSEARYRQIVEGAEDFAIIVTDDHGTITSWNSGAERITGIPAAEAMGQPDAIIFTPEDRERGEPDHEMNRAHADGRSINERWHLRRDGSRFWGSGLTMRLDQPGGGYLKIFRDRTAEHEAEAAVRRSETSLRDLAETLEARVAERTAERDRMWDTSPDLMLVIDFQGVFRRVNPAWTAVLGYSPEELVGHHVNEFVVPDDHTETAAAYETAAHGGQPRLVNRYRHKDGSLRWISWTAAPAGELTYATGRDITAEKERQAELEQAQEALRQSQKMEAMGSLTGGVAHDFNNLLTPIVAVLDRLQRQGLGGERERRLIAGAAQSAERARVLVQRLLAFARRQPLQPGPVDLAGLVGGVREIAASTLGPRVQLALEVAPDLPAVLADANQLEMALLNLVVNARDAMPEGGRLTIAAALEEVGRRHRSKLRPGRYVRLSVSDSGTGMAPEVLARAVEPFFSTKGVGRGTGLGLSMVHGLAGQLGGGLTLASWPGQGTTVELWLPASDEAAPGAQEADGAVDLPLAAGTALLVDDEELVRAATADMLAELGYGVVEAGSAEDALALLDGGLEPEVLVTDHLMPGMTGTALARVLQVRRPSLPVLVVSGYAESEGIAPDLPRLVKPFRQAELAAALASCSHGSDQDGDGARLATATERPSE